MPPALSTSINTNCRYSKYNNKFNNPIPANQLNWRLILTRYPCRLPRLSPNFDALVSVNILKDQCSYGGMIYTYTFRDRSGKIINHLIATASELLRCRHFTPLLASFDLFPPVHTYIPTDKHFFYFIASIKPPTLLLTVSSFKCLLWIVPNFFFSPCCFFSHLRFIYDGVVQFNH